MRWFYVGWLGIMVGAIVLQFYLAGYGVFAFKGLDPFVPHFVVGDLIAIASLLAIGLAFAARVPWRLTIMNVVIFVLMLIQFVLAHTGVQVISALHVVNGVVIFGVTFYLTREASRLVMPARAPSAAPVK